MKPGDSQILVGTVGKDVFVRVEGKGTHMVSQQLREFLFQMIETGFRSFLLDLNHCTYMDSTFLGMLVGVSLRLKAVTPSKISIVHINERNLDLFRTLGIESFFQIDHAGKAPDSAKPEAMQSLPEGKAATQGWAETMLEAHETLAKVNEQNVCRFKDVIAFLKEDVAKLKTGSSSSSAPSDKTGS
jgi:anti-anti-sigma factor